MNAKVLMLSIAVPLVVFVSAAGGAEKKHSCSLHGLTFESSVEFSAPEKAGLDALMMRFPGKSKPGKEKIGIMAVLYTRESQKTMGMGDAGLLTYTKNVFMGVLAAGRPVERVFAGARIKGDCVDKNIPSPMTVETYVLKLANGSRVGIGFSYVREFKADADRIITEIFASMKELP